MKFAVEQGTIGDNSLAATIRYCQDLGIQGISVPWTSVPGYGEKGYIEAAPVKAIRAQIEDAGLALASMVAWAPSAIMAGDAEAKALFDNLRRSMEAMATAGSDTVIAFPPMNEESQWPQAAGFYHKFAAVGEQCKVRIANHPHGILRDLPGNDPDDGRRAQPVQRDLLLHGERVAWRRRQDVRRLAAVERQALFRAHPPGQDGDG